MGDKFCKRELIFLWKILESLDRDHFKKSRRKEELSDRKEIAYNMNQLPYILNRKEYNEKGIRLFTVRTNVVGMLRREDSLADTSRKENEEEFKRCCFENDVRGLQQLINRIGADNEVFLLNESWFKYDFLNWEEQVRITLSMGRAPEHPPAMITPLMRACALDQVSLVEILLKYFASKIDWAVNIRPSICICIGRSLKCLHTLVNHPIVQHHMLRMKEDCRVILERLERTKCIESVRIILAAHPEFPRMASPSLLKAIEDKWEEGIDYLTDIGQFLWSKMLNACLIHWDPEYLLSLLKSGRVRIHDSESNAIGNDAMSINLDRALLDRVNEYRPGMTSLLVYLGERGQAFARANNRHCLFYLPREDTKRLIQNGVVNELTEQEACNETILRMFQGFRMQLFLMASAVPLPLPLSSPSASQNQNMEESRCTVSSRSKAKTQSVAHDYFFQAESFERHLVVEISKFLS